MFNTDTPEAVATVTADAPIDATQPGTSELISATYTFASVALLIVAGFGLILLAVFIIVIAPLLAKMLPPEFGGVVDAVSDVALDSIDGGLDKLKDKMRQNGVGWDDEILDMLDTWLEGKRQESADNG